MVFGTKRDNKPDSGLREDVVGSLYPDSFPNEAEMTPSAMDYRRQDFGNESVIDPHARFNGKYVSDRDLRIEGEANGEIECSGTLVISPQAKVRSTITAANVIINGDYEGDVNCQGRFEIGSTGRVKGKVRAQVLVVREGAHFEGNVMMSPENTRASAAASASASSSTSGATATPAAESGSKASATTEPATPAPAFSGKERDSASGGSTS